MSEHPLLSVQHLSRRFGQNRAVDDVSFDIHRGEVLGLVGESGCGKTTVGRCIIGLTPVTGGQIFFEGTCMAAPRSRVPIQLGSSRADRIRMADRIQMIFQDPLASLDPRMTVREIIAEGLIIRGMRDRRAIENKVNDMLDRVGLDRSFAERYPHEFSGGQRQRIGVARAVILQPSLIIADEPVSALDVSVQAQVINLLADLRREMGLTVLFVAHDLSVVKYVSDRIGVMYFGKLVELASSEELFRHPLHPYTQSLLSAIPIPDPAYEKQRQRILYDPAKRHMYTFESPVWQEVAPGHFVLCNSVELQQYRQDLHNNRRSLLK